MSFVHLHVHSEYSLLEASLGIKDLAKKAAQLQMPAVALTDNGNMFGAIEFYFACREKNVKPIIGLDAYLAPTSRLIKGATDRHTDRFEGQKPLSRIVLLATSQQGYRNLCQISSIGYQEGFYYKPRIDEEVLRKYHQDLIVLSGGIRGEIASLFFQEGPEAALKRIRQMQEIFPERFYLEMNRTGVAQWKELNAFLQEAAKITGAPLVAANDVHYLEQEDQIAQEVLICIGTNKTLNDESRFRLGSDQFYFKSAEEMQALFQDVPEALENTLRIAEQCQIQFQLKDAQGKPIYHLPSIPTVNGVSLQEEIKRSAFAGLEVRFHEAKKRNEEIAAEKHESYRQRLEFELSIIDRMGFNGYFLIVADFINWAKQQDIPVGPGRGSGAGSLVAFCLRITDLDPMPYSLLFERFLNPERISMPDFDIDFCQDRRQEVIQYVTEKYGQKSVSQIITYGKLQCKAAIKDVGRVLGMSFAEVNAITNLVPEKLNITIAEALEQEPRLREQIEMNPQIATLLDLAQRVEGLVRHAGIHAAGVIIASDELVQYAPLYKGADGENVVQFDMKHAEKIGLIKFDFLGLKTLTLIHHALQIIKKNRGKSIAESEISIHDPGIYQLMSKGDTAGVFQFEGDGITNAIRLIKPSSFYDITAINALYRPGPMAVIPDFAKCKNGEKEIVFVFPELQQVLQETYGFIVYQEQVMAIASIIAGYSLGEADMLRRAMGKKIKEEMDQQRTRFLQGALKRGFDEKKSEEVFELMYKFADYGFNKSHAAAYCVVAAQTAWLKYYYPAEFFAALLSTELGDTDKVVQYVKDAQKHGLKILPPSLNNSDFNFTVKGEDIYYGLGAIKGVGESAINVILESRDSRPERKFSSIEDFFETTDPRKLNKKNLEALIKAGAFDEFQMSRAQLFSGYQKYLDRAEEVRREKELGQASLFDLGGGQEKKVLLDPVKPWPRSMALTYEKEVLGFYLSDHPLKGYEKMATLWATCQIQDLVKVYEEFKSKQSVEQKPVKYDFRNRDGHKKKVTLVGVISESRELITKKGTRMAFAKLEDLTGSVELVVFPDAFALYESILKDERPLLMTGFLEAETGNPKIIVESVMLFEDSLKKTRRMVLHLHQLDEVHYEKLNSLLVEHPGPTQVELLLQVAELNQNVTLTPQEIQGVQVSHEFLESLQQHFGKTDFVEMGL